MQFLPVREFRLHPGAVWRRLSKEGELILTARGRPVGLLTPVDESSFERVLRAWRQARGLAALSELQEEAKRRGLNRWTMRRVVKEIRSIRAQGRRAS